MPDGAGLVLRFGEQLDTQTVNSGPTGELTPEHAARYIAKYATKSAEDFGLGDRRITPETLPLLGVTDHVDRLVRIAWQLGEHPAYEGLRRWLHMIGFRGHFASKSRRYSTTLGAIRGERRAYRQRRPPNTPANCSTTTPPSSSRTGNSPDSATSPPETQHSRCPRPSEHANDDKPQGKPLDAKRLQAERNSHSGRVRGLALRTAARAEVVQRGRGR